VTPAALDRRPAEAMAGAPGLERIWQALEQVKDPEIPVISIVELGLIRQVARYPGKLTVTLSPSFVGCPALDVMVRQVREVLEGLGEPAVEVRTVFSPPWTSDWITQEGREKLRRFGLAPPPRHGGDLDRVLDEAARCPYCDSLDTELKNSFGSTPCRSIYVCNACVQPFEQFKPL
jgi:ring-1,2-phenylacetyl-CoA epoxidase subunit PaaD